MKSIGFTNFRRFENFEDMELAPITVFVGENNAGKSTVVKAILSVLSFLVDNASFVRRIIFTEKPSKQYIKQKFYFNKNYFAHVGTFKRAVNKTHQNEPITFKMKFKNSLVEISVKETSDKTSDPENVAYGDVKTISIDFFLPNVRFEFNLEYEDLNVTFYSFPSKLFKFSEPQIHNSDLAKYEENKQKQQAEVDSYYQSFCDENLSLHCKLIPLQLLAEGSPLQMLMEYALSNIEQTFFDKHTSLPFMNDVPGFRVDDEWKDLLKENKSIYDSLQKNISSIILLKEFPDVEYIYAHAATQSVVYSSKDKGDYVSTTIHDFASININSKSKNKDKNIYEFIKKWMGEFHIGDDYSVESVGGESHTVKIIDGNQNVYLSDKGMGSIQIMILLFRLATLIKQRRRGTTIIIEEPEQNLHPCLQSKLANLFKELHNDYKFKLIVETHSEYLIRMIQVLTGEFKNKTDEEFEKSNPFKVIYFPNDGTPWYDMKLTKTGRFLSKFRPGFFNEAGRLDTIVSNNIFDSL